MVNRLLLAIRSAKTPSGSCLLCAGSSCGLPPTSCVSKLNLACAAFTWAKSIRHICRSLSPRILAGTFVRRAGRHLTHQGHCEGFKFLDEMLAAHLPRRGHAIHLAGSVTASSRQGTSEYALLVQNVQISPLHQLMCLPKLEQLSKRLLLWHRSSEYSGRKAPVPTADRAR